MTDPMGGYDDGPATQVRPPHQQQGYGGPPPHPEQFGGWGRPMGYGPMGYGWSRPRRQYPIETKPFFLTSEFAIGIVSVLAISITAATNTALGVRLTWILIAAMVCAYLVSRGIAKSGTRSNSWDPRETFDPTRRGHGEDGDS